MIETDRLILRPHDIGDFAGYRPLWRPDPDPAAVRVPVLSEEEAWARLLRLIGHWTSFGFGPFVALDRATGGLIGEAGFAWFRRGHGEDFDSAPEAMWKLDADWRGRGLAGEAMAGAIDWFDRRRPEARTVCMIDPANHRSRGLAARFGYRPMREAAYRGEPVTLYERRRP